MPEKPLLELGKTLCDTICKINYWGGRAAVEGAYLQYSALEDSLHFLQMEVKNARESLAKIQDRSGD